MTPPHSDTIIDFEAYVAVSGSLLTVADVLDVDSFDSEDVWQDQGRCTFTIPLPKPASLVTDAVVIVKLNGTEVFALIVNQLVQVELSEPAREGVQATCSFVPVVLARGLVHPSRGYGAIPFSDTRLFSVFSPEFDISGWITASAIVSHQGDASTYYTGNPSGWTYPDSVLIGPQNGDDSHGEIGQWWTQAEFTLVDDTNVVFDSAADNWAELYLDGQMIGNVNGWGATTSVTVFCKAGTHRIGAKVYNAADYTSETPPLNSFGVVTAGNPTFFLLAAFPVDWAGRRGGLIIQTDTNWRIRAFLVSPPGWTIGHAMRVLLDENHFEGILPAVTAQWTDTHDTLGVAWPVHEHLSIDVGRTLLDVVMEWRVTYFDWSLAAHFASNEYRLFLYNWSRSPFVDSAVDYEHDEDDAYASTLDELTTTTGQVIADCVLVRWAGGFLREPLTGGYKQAFLKLAKCHSEGEARLVAQRWMQVFGVEREQIAGKVAPNDADALVGNIPYLHFNNGNGVTVNGNLERVVKIALHVVDGNVEFDVATRDWIDYVEDRIEWAIRRLSDGT